MSPPSSSHRKVDFMGLLIQFLLLSNISMMVMTRKLTDALYMDIVFTAAFPANMFLLSKMKLYGGTAHLVAAGLNFELSHEPEESLGHLLHLLQHEDRYRHNSACSGPAHQVPKL